MLAGRLRAWVLLCVALFAAMLGAGCGGGGGSPGITSGTSGGGSATTGTLAVVVSTPGGVAGALQISGPNNFARALTQSATLAGLAPGNYTIAAAGIALGATQYMPLPAGQTVTVAAGAIATATVSYAARAPSLGLTEVASGLDRPVFLAAPDGDSRQFIVLRGGRIRVMQGGALLPQPFLDISAGVSTAGEGGLLSVAFDPGYASNGYFYLYYTDQQQNIVIERFRAQPGANVADPASGLVILRVPHQQYANHYGGQLAFGTDGLLYIGTGDGGGEGDPLGNGRNPDALLAKMLRIDVSHASAGAPYAVPPSNPFVGQAHKRAEIWASGLRNPWRFTLDGAQIYIADVGQDRREEVDIADTAQGGLDFGWNLMEGTLCLKDGCDRSGLTLPALEYGHGDAAGGACAIVGGFVYRGAALAELAGRYFYSDYCAGFLKSLYFSGGGVLEQRTWPLPAIGAVVSFGRDGQGELYLVAASGSIYKIGRSFAPKS